MLILSDITCTAISQVMTCTLHKYILGHKHNKKVIFICAHYCVYLLFRGSDNMKRTLVDLNVLHSFRTFC